MAPLHKPIYLITGGCGFIGSHLAEALVAEGSRIRILDDLSTGTIANLPPAADLIEGDVADPDAIARAIEGVDGCFHLAAVASVERTTLEWLAAHRTNLTGTITVLDAARRAQSRGPIPVVYASSAAVYGDNSNLPLMEDASVHPLSAYGADKLGCELHAAVGSQIHNVPACGLRLFNVYGPRQYGMSIYSGVISIFAARMKAGRDITIYGDGGQARDFIYVGDVVRALLAAMERSPVSAQVLNICTGKASSILELAHTIAELLAIQPRISFAPARVGDIRVSVGDPTKARERLGFEARTRLVDGLKATLDALP
jgi:UDP-glucose 4-epimerase